MSLRTACTLLFAVFSLGAAAPIRAAGEKSPAQDRVIGASMTEAMVARAIVLRSSGPTRMAAS